MRGVFVAQRSRAAGTTAGAVAGADVWLADSFGSNINVPCAVASASLSLRMVYIVPIISMCIYTTSHLPHGFVAVAEACVHTPRVRLRTHSFV